MFLPSFRSFLQINISDPNIFPAARFANINTIVGIIAPALTIGAVIIFGAMLMWAGYTIISAAGEPEKVQQAQQTATSAIIGLLIVVTAFLVVRLLAFIFQIELPL